MKATPPFRFKQFVIQQDRAAMKVGFDGVLLGAWADTHEANRILDVGTGTGVIALMLAQRTAECTRIDAVDIDTESAAEAAFNFQNSRWADRLSAHQRDFRDTISLGRYSYDLVVSNPPFYTGGGSSISDGRRTARHDDSLCLEDIVRRVSSLLAADGELALVLPYHRADECEALASESNLHLARKMSVRPNPETDFHRVLLQFSSRDVSNVHEEEMAIEIARHEYSKRFRDLAKEFYLKL